MVVSHCSDLVLKSHNMKTTSVNVKMNDVGYLYCSSWFTVLHDGIMTVTSWNTCTEQSLD